MPRAKRDFGTIRKRANGRFQAYYMGPDQGFHRAPSTFEMKADAEAWLAAERRLIQYDEWTPSRSRRAKVLRATSEFGEYARLWLENRDLKPRTRYLYGRLLDRFILPTFGQMSMRDITPPVVRVWHSQLELDHSTQRSHAYSLLRAILATAVSDEIIDANPCRVRGAGSTTRARRVEPASLSELEVLVRTMPARYQALVLLAAWCGLRFGEVTELRRHDIDLVAGVLHVRRGVVRIAGEVTVGTPKSQAGIRGVAIPPHLVPALEEHLAQCVGPEPDALVFAAVGNPQAQVHPNTIYRHWYRARDAAGRPDLRIHDLRHTGAVMAAQAGATLADLMARLGHSTPQAALRYQHAARGRDAEIADALSRMAQPDLD